MRQACNQGELEFARAFPTPAIQINRTAVSTGYMRSDPDRRGNFALGGLCAAVVLGILLWNRHQRHAHPPDVDDNPNKFVLWKANYSYRYTFTYDPHAADVWLFESGGGVRGINTKSSVLPNPKWTWTNRVAVVNGSSLRKNQRPDQVSIP